MGHIWNCNRIPTKEHTWEENGSITKDIWANKAQYRGAKYRRNILLYDVSCPKGDVLAVSAVMSRRNLEGVEPVLGM